MLDGGIDTDTDTDTNTGTDIDTDTDMFQLFCLLAAILAQALTASRIRASSLLVLLSLTAVISNG